MAIATFSADTITKRASFMRIVFDEMDGYVCIARIRRADKDYVETFYRIPEQWPELLAKIDEWSFDYDVYFCPMTFSRPKRVKDNVTTCKMVWADLDECHPGLLKVLPSILIQTSPERFQALWRLSEHMDPVDAEAISRRIAYFHADDGADTSGWDLTQLMRVPFTANWKYVDPAVRPEPEFVYVVTTTPDIFTAEDFSEYPEVAAPLNRPIPERADLPYEGDSAKILEAFRLRIPTAVYNMWTDEPLPGAWSQTLWKLEMNLFEAGMSPEETYIVCRDSACNKFRRDGKLDVYLWKDVLRAYEQHNLRNKAVKEEDILNDGLLSQAEMDLVAQDRSVIDEYVDWAKSLGDAAWEYHEAGAFTILSSLLAGIVRLPTAFGTIIPNLWFMILADTTLTRKTTAMDLAMDIIVDIDPDAVLATDGSIEGLFTSLSTRPGRPSIFLRDEFSGLLEQFSKREYYAGMAETLTKLYDGRYQKRVLRRETIEVREPVLIMFAGGIKDRILSLLRYEHVASGFTPRFMFISAESNVTALRPLGPPTSDSIEGRHILLKRFSDIHNHYAAPRAITVNGRTTTEQRKWDVQLTPEAWARYNIFERQMLETGLKAFHKDLVTPTLDRLSKSGLKLAILLAAARNLGDIVTVELIDILHAIQYIMNWRRWSIMVVNSVGTTTSEKMLDRILKAIQAKPGVQRSELMQLYRLSAKDAEMVFGTLDQRGQISRVKHSRTERLFPIAT